MRLINRMISAGLIVAAILTISACVDEDSHPIKGKSSEQPNVIKHEVEFGFVPTQLPDGSKTIQLGVDTGEHNLGLISSIEYEGKIVQYLQILHDDDVMTYVLLSFDPNSMETMIHWKQSLKGSDNRGYNSFVSQPGLLGKLGNEDVLFMEPEVTSNLVQYHLSTLNVRTGAIERIRERLLTFTDAEDYIYLSKWNAELDKLFVQSFKGTVWIINLQSGEEQVHDNKFEVIPHSTTGYPSLFPSPLFDRFVHDDDSGGITFYTDKGEPLESIKLPDNKYIPSAKVEWNREGTVAWMNSASADPKRVKSTDMDLLMIAPEQVDLFDQDGHPIGSIQAKQGRSVDIVNWLDSETAVVKEYDYHEGEEITETNVSYYSYSITTEKRTELPSYQPKEYVNSPPEYQIKVMNNEISYKKSIPIMGEGGLHEGMGRIESYFYRGEDHKADFMKHLTMPYGLYIPKFMKQHDLPDGTEWVFGEQVNSIALFDGKLVRSEAEFYDPEQGIYKEYAGSRRMKGDRVIDYYSIRDQEQELLIKLAYTEEDRNEILPFLQAVLTSIKYVHSREQFESGVFITYDEKAMNETDKEIISTVIDSMKAIIAKDKKGFASTLESPGLAEALQFFLADGVLYRFDELIAIEPIDDKRINVAIQYQMLSKEGFSSNSVYAFTMRQNKSDVWKIANID